VAKDYGTVEAVTLEQPLTRLRRLGYQVRCREGARRRCRVEADDPSPLGVSFAGEGDTLMQAAGDLLRWMIRTHPELLEQLAAVELGSDEEVR
jgi:hypothetical protein